MKIKSIFGIEIIDSILVFIDDLIIFFFRHVFLFFIVCKILLESTFNFFPRKSIRNFSFFYSLFNFMNFPSFIHNIFFSLCLPLVFTESLNIKLVMVFI